MRLFIAINFDKQTKENVSAVQSKLKERSKGSYTPPGNIHLTLVFLGEIPKEKIDCIKQAMNQMDVSSFKIQFSHIDYFKRNDGDICWIGLRQNKKLILLQKNLCFALLENGFNIEKRIFKPHITLGRRIRFYNSIEKKIILDKSFETDVNSISLMKSERINSRLIYTEIYKHP